MKFHSLINNKISGKKQIKDIKVDLHIHTKYSDGSSSLQDLFDNLYFNDVKIASITDHNNFEAYNNLNKINKHRIKLIIGMEVDVDYKGSILHILLYSFDKNCPSIKNYCELIRKNDINTFERMIEKVCEINNINISKQKILDFEESNQYFDKVRLNNFLVELGIANSAKYAYYQFTKDIEDKKRLAISAEKFFAMARESGAITSLAHPMKYIKNFNDMQTLKKVIMELKSFGLDSIEVFNNRQNSEEELELYKFAVENNFGISGGSDYHAKFGSVEKKELGKALGKNIYKKMLNII